ncbi:methylmalonyl-CoA mutase [bacterium]|nr:methylmalonyl-CoA mutase [bacterium]
MKKEQQDTKQTISGIELAAVYAPSKLSPEIGRPGEFPYTRGIHSTMYRSRFWTMRQYAGFGTAQETNKRYHYLLSQGTTGLSVAFDLPTQMGRDADQAIVKGEVGKVGVSISTLEDMQTLFAGINLSQVSTSMTINSTAAILLGFYLALARQQGISWDQVSGTVQNDILKEYIARGTYIYPPRPALKLVTDIIEFCSKEVPQWNTISISGYHIREAGSTAPQELAFTFADAIVYVEQALQRGISIDAFAPRLAFFFNCQIDFLEEIAKFRAARRIWAKIMKERFGAKDPKSQMLRFHVQTAGSSLVPQEPLVNAVRTSIEALAAVLGGAQSLHTNSYDEALGLPTEDAARLALRTQQVIAYESGLTNTVDPFGGSYCIENLTDTIERETKLILEAIEARGGMLQAIEENYPQQEIERSAYEYQKKIDSHERIVVALNKFNENSAAAKVPVFKVDAKLEQDQRERVQAFKAKRDQQLVASKLAQLKQAASQNQNVMPEIIEAVSCGVTLGEISNIFRELWGEY